jgi:dihydrolipoamide dehydrogenase
MAIGVQPLLPAGGLKLALNEKGYIQTNERYETNVPGVYAAGDIIGPPWLAHAKSRQESSHG